MVKQLSTFKYNISKIVVSNTKDLFKQKKFLDIFLLVELKISNKTLVYSSSILKKLYVLTLLQKVLIKSVYKYSVFPTI